MRFIFLFSLALFFATSSVHAQSVSENVPQEMSQDEPDVAPPAAPSSAPIADPYTVTDVAVDVTADNATHARDKALMQAERDAYMQLCTRLSASEGAAKMNDDGVAALVQSFEVQSERLSTVRYIGVFTIRFNPSTVQKKVGRSAPVVDVNGNVIVSVDKQAPQGVQSHVTAAVVTDSLAAWTQIKRRLVAVPQIAQVDTLDLGRGLSHINIAYTGTLSDLQQAVTAQGFVLRQNQIGVWELTDGSMVAR